MAKYIRCFSHPETIHATCEDYRASAGIDLDHDRADLDTKIDCPLLVLWGEHGAMERHCDMLAVWRERASNVRGRTIACGHFLAKEAPAETEAALLDFLRG
jgi:haloacetate dehalogenase